MMMHITASSIRIYIIAIRIFFNIRGMPVTIGVVIGRKWTVSSATDIQLGNVRRS